MGQFSNIFDGIDEYDDLDDPVDMVLATDAKLSKAIKEAEEEGGIVDADDIINALEEKGELPMQIDNDEPEPYHEEYDDAIMPDEVDAKTFREAYEDNVSDDLAEDDDIDAVLDYDTDSTEFSDLSDDEML